MIIGNSSDKYSIYKTSIYLLNFDVSTKTKLLLSQPVGLLTSATFKPKLVDGQLRHCRKKRGARGKAVLQHRLILDGRNIVRNFLVKKLLPKNAKCGAKKLPFWTHLKTEIKLWTFIIAAICENSVRNFQCLSENFKFLFHPFFQHNNSAGAKLAISNFLFFYSLFPIYYLHFCFPFFFLAPFSMLLK